jgi:hypothetical protein
MKPGITWRRDEALRAALCLVPAIPIIAVVDIAAGIAFAFGILLACLLGIAPNRRQQLKLMIPGVICALAIAAGGLLGARNWLALLGLFLVCWSASALTYRRPRFRGLALSLVTVLVAAGISIGAAAAAAFGLVIVGAVAWSTGVALLVKRLWPQSASPQQAPPAAVTAAAAQTYGWLLGSAATLALLAGILLDASHIAWGSVAALAVMRPSPATLRIRAAGRVIAVLLGAVGALIVISLGLTSWPLAIMIALVVIATVATRTSHWYLTSGGTTFLVLIMLAASDPTTIDGRFWERLYMTAIGVSLAYLFGIVAPAWLERRSTRSAKPSPLPL